MRALEPGLEGWCLVMVIMASPVVVRSGLFRKPFKSVAQFWDVRLENVGRVKGRFRTTSLKRDIDQGHFDRADRSNLRSHRRGVSSVSGFAEQHHCGANPCGACADCCLAPLPLIDYCHLIPSRARRRSVRRAERMVLY